MTSTLHGVATGAVCIFLAAAFSGCETTGSDITSELTDAAGQISGGWWPKKTPTGEFTLSKPIKHQRQLDDEHCWLACASMIYDYNGFQISQEELAKEVAKILIKDNPLFSANERECKIALAGKGGSIEKLREWRQNIFNTGNAQSQLNPIETAELLKLINDTKNPLMMVEALQNAEPAVAVFRLGDEPDAPRHAMIVVGLTVEKAGPKGSATVTKIDLVDPGSETGAIITKDSKYVAARFERAFTRSNSLRQFEIEAKYFQTSNKPNAGGARPSAGKESKAWTWKPLK